MADVNELLRLLRDQNGSDLHLAAGQPPRIRRHGDLAPVEGRPTISSEEMQQSLAEITPKHLWERYLSTRDVDFAHALKGVGRFRVNLFAQEHGAAAVFRLIPEEIVPLDKLNMPPVLERFAHLNDGFVLVTGPTGSGKSTTLAAIVDRINTNYSKHIVTIEDPVEFVHRNKKSVLSHREVGHDTNNFAEAVRVATREDADVLLLGELRDFETISRALDAAEMGMLVFGTLHTNGAASTIDRILSVFPGAQQPMVRTILASSLAGIVSQSLLPCADGRGRVAACEVLLRTPALASVIRDGNLSMIDSIIQSGRAEGMQLMDDAIFNLAKAGQLVPKVAYLAARDKGRFERLAASAPTGQTTARVVH